MSYGLVPGQIQGKTATSRDCLLSVKEVTYGRGTIDSTKAYNGIDTGYESRIWAGTPLAMIAATYLWVPCKQTAVTSGGGTTATAVPVLNAAFFRVGDVITVGSNTGWTITAIDYVNNILTGASITFNNSDAVHATDGSQICRGILNEELDMWEPMTRKYQNVQFGHMVIRGVVDPNRVWGDIVTIRAATSTLAAQFPGILFADTAGQYGPLN